MRFSAEVEDHLRGRRFSSGLALKIGTPEKSFRSRLSYLEELSAGKRIIHVGFCDHVERIEDKLRNDQWLHGRLRRRATRCLGIDIDARAVDYVRNRLSIPDVHVHDVVNDAPLAAIVEEDWEVMVLGEVLEHTDNPALFLRSVREKYRRSVRRFVVTVPNAYDLVGLKRVFGHEEFINSDHRYWFTPYTLARVATAAGLRPIEFEYCQSYPPRTVVERFLIRRWPELRESIVMTFEVMD